MHISRLVHVHVMSDFLLSWMVQQLPTEAAILLHTLTDEPLAISARAQQLCDRFPEGSVLEAAKRCRDTCVESFTLEFPSRHQSFLNRERVGLRFSAKRPPGGTGLRLITIEQVVDYDTISQQLDDNLFMIETLPKGVGLFRVDMKTGENRVVLFSNNYCRLVGSSPQEVREPGVPHIWDRIPAEEQYEIRRRMNAGLTNLAQYNCVFRIRIDDQYRWLKVVANCIPGSSTDVVEASFTTEECNQAEPTPLELADRATGNASTFMLSSFVSALFDVSFFVDSKFRIVDDSPKVRHFFTTNPTASLMDRSIELFMPQEEDKVIFREFMARSLQTKSKIADPTTSTAPMIRLKLCLAGVCTDVELYATPTFYHHSLLLAQREAPQTASVSTSTSAIVPNRAEEGYLLGLRVLPVEDSDSDACTDPLADLSDKVPRQTLPKFLASIVQEVGIDAASSHSTDTYALEGGTPPVPRAPTDEKSPPGIFLAQAYYRLLVQDLTMAIDSLNEGALKGEAAASPSSRICIDSLVPLFDVSDMPAMEEELIRALPNDKQAAFIRASSECNYLVCSQLMGSCVEGNANFLSPFQGANLCKNPDLLHCLFRFYLGLLTSMHGESAYTLLLTLSSSLNRIEPILGELTSHIAHQELTLALISCAIVHPDWFEAPISMQWLRQAFTGAVQEQTPTLSADKSRRLPPVYWICTLWAALHRSIGRTQEAKRLLEHVFGDMSTYSMRHPESTSVRQLQAVTAHNLAMIALAQGEGPTADMWVKTLKTIVAESHVELPLGCCRLLEWSAAKSSSASSSIATT